MSKASKWVSIKRYIPTQLPCDACGRLGDNGMNPEFGYVVCAAHAQLAQVALLAYGVKIKL